MLCEVHFVVLDKAMDFWTLLAIALAVLWAQANVISCAGLYALRAEARVRWEALVALERSLLECRQEAGGDLSKESARWRLLLNQKILPENGPEVVEFFKEQRLWRVAGASAGLSVLESRCRQAARCYGEAAARYNRGIPAPLGWPLSRWIGFIPVQEPPQESVPV